MYTEEYNGINAFLVGSSKLLVSEGVKRETRGELSYELSEPFMFKIINPGARIITIPERKWNVVLPYAESLWIASGRNDMDYIIKYLPRMLEFSDDSITMRGGYGPRLRHYNYSKNDYAIKSFYPSTENEVDQLKYVCQCFDADKNTRRAIISLGDVVKDCTDKNRCLKETKDIPCTRELHFVKQAGNNKLDLIVNMRSNDLIWGASAVNVFNYTFMQEYMASILGLQLGCYYHIANNMHYYVRHKDKLINLSKLNDIEDVSYNYMPTFHSLQDFDNLLFKLSNEEYQMRTNTRNYKYYEFNDPFFMDWYNILYSFNFKKKVNYINPLLDVVACSIM